MQLDADAAHELGVGAIAGQQQHRLGRDGRAGIEHDLVGADLDHPRIEVRLDGSFLDAILDVGLDPVLHRIAEPGAAMHHRHVAAGAVDLERGFGGGVLAADNHHALAVIRMRLLVEVRDVRQIFAGHVEHIRQLVVAHRQHHVAGFADARHAARRCATQRRSGLPASRVPPAEAGST